MGKKRGKEKNSREDEGDSDRTGPSCRHIRKRTDQTLLKKLAGNSDWTCCQDCKLNENKENTNPSSPPESDDGKGITAVWMCLKCGHRGCGRHSENQHAIKHYETPRSEPHCLVISLDNWSVWCYICDDEVQYSTTSQLAQLVTNIKKKTSAPIQRPQTEMEGENTETVKADESEENENKENMSHQKKSTRKENVIGKSSTTENSGGLSVKGLSNLGNTCFFNAVIQNLSQTHLLRQTLNNVTEQQTSVNIEPDSSSSLEPVVAQVDQPGSLTLAMCQLLNEIQESKRGVVTPRELFTQVCKKAARFKGFQQQDSQELLRYLLDGMRAEELKRVSAGLLEALKQARKGTDEEQLKRLVKEYEKNGFPKNFVDQVFGGEMTSTIMCQQCKTVSVVTEMFLDLSLPVADEAYRKKNQKKSVQRSSESSQDGRESPALTNGSENFPTGSGSKYQQKKAKKQAKKQAKNQKRQQRLEDRVTLDMLTSPGHTDGEQEDPTGKADHGVTNGSEPHDEAPVIEEDPAQSSVSKKDQRDPEEIQAEKGTKEDEDSVDCDSSASNRFTVLSEEQQPKGGVLADEQPSDTSQAAEVDSQLVRAMEKVNLDDAFIDSNTVEQSMESEDEPQEAKEYTVVNQDPEMAFGTLAHRSPPEKQECSVQSCLFQFTEVETLTQNNSLLCVTCTKRQLKKDKTEESKKNVYTDALKQMLISSPPPVLTLHLKRFQQNGYSICKVNRHVHFPLILDLAPFCGVKCKNVGEGDCQILYSLYGIVEHSGTMRSGHYTAYVKARTQGCHPSSDGLAADGGEPSRGSWFHISDTSVQPVSESKVQSCQAYLLFYERLL